MGMKCDLPGLSFVFRQLFRERGDAPRALVDLVGLLARPNHDERPDLESIRRCCARLVSREAEGRRVWNSVVRFLQPFLCCCGRQRS